MREGFKKVEKLFTKKVDGKTAKPVISFKDNEKYPLLNIPLNSTLVKHIIACAKKHGVKMKPYSSGGGYDANILCGKRFMMPIMGIGFRKMHSVNEWLDLKKYNQTADIVADIVTGYRK